MPFSKQHRRLISLMAPCNKTVSSSRPEQGAIVTVAKSLTLTNTLFKKAWERAEGSDRIKSSNPFLQAAASAEETLEDRDAEIWAHGSGMEDVWRCSQHSLRPASSPPTHSPALIELFALPPVIVAGAPNSVLVTGSPGKFSSFIPTRQQPSAHVPKHGLRTAESLGKEGRSSLHCHDNLNFQFRSVEQWKLC